MPPGPQVTSTLPGSLSRRESGRIVALLALASLAFGLLWTVESASAVDRWTEERIVDPWAERGAFSYEPLREDGTALPMGEPGYFTSDAPRVRVRFEWRLEDPAAERVTAFGDLALALSAPASPGRAAWTHVEPLANATLSGAPGEPLTLEGILDLPALAARLSDRRLEDATWTIAAEVRFASAPLAAHASEGSAFQLPLSYTPPLYTFPDELETTKDHSARETVLHEERDGVRGLLERPAGPALLLLGLIGVIATRRVRLEEVAA